MVRFEAALQGLMLQLSTAKKTAYGDLLIHPRTEDEARKHFKHRNPLVCNVQKQVALSNGRTRWVYLTLEGVLQSINSPILIEQQATDGSSAVTLIHLARLGDNISDNAFTTIPAEAFNKTIMALMKDGAANIEGFNRLDGQVAALVKVDQSAATIRDLHWESNIAPNAPVLVCLDKIFPVLPG